MQTFYTIPRARNFEELLSATISGPLIDRVIKKEWPKHTADIVATVLKIEPSDVKLACQVKSTIHTYRLQHSAIESEHTPDEASGADVSDTLDCLFENVEQTWEQKFASEICWLIENRKTVVDDETIPIGPDVISFDLPRTSLFGRKVQPLRLTGYVDKDFGARVELNPKYDRCPRQVLDFHPDTVHFMFPDLSKWAGQVKFCEIPKWQGETDDPPYIGRRFFRVVMSCAAKPFRTDLGTLYTILPAGWRGWLYKTVWKLLGVKP